MGLQITWFVIVAVFWTGFFVLEGFDLGVGILHMVVGKTDTERRVAINTIGPFWDANEVWLVVGRRGDLRRLPVVVRHLVLGALPRADDRARGAHRAGRLLRVPRQGRERPLAGHVELDAHDRQPPAARCCSASRWATCSTACPSTRTASSPARSSTCSRPTGSLGRRHPAGADAAPRRGVPVAEDDRDRARPGPPAQRPLRSDRRRRRGRLRRLDPGRGRPGRGARAAAAARGLRHLRRRLVGARRARGMGLRGHVGGHGHDRRVDLHQPLPERHGLEHRLGLQPDRRQLGFQQLRAHRDDGRRGGPGAVRAAVPGLELLRLPGPDPGPRADAADVADVAVVAPTTEDAPQGT